VGSCILVLLLCGVVQDDGVVAATAAVMLMHGRVV
jgi:hypothetical protein